jgi:hypothetical protein
LPVRGIGTVITYGSGTRIGTGTVKNGITKEKKRCDDKFIGNMLLPLKIKRQDFFQTKFVNRFSWSSYGTKAGTGTGTVTGQKSGAEP